MAGAIAQDRERCQFRFWLMKNPLSYRSARPGERSGGKRKVSYGDARSNSERAAPSACVGRRLSAPQIVWNRSTRRSGARGGPRVDRPRWLRILSITGGSSIAAIIFKAPPQLGQCSISPCRHRACRDRNGGVNPRNASRVRQLWSAVWRIEFAGGLAGLLWLLAWAGSKVLNPTRIDWLISGGDWSQHLMGWLFFRNESPGLPLGRLDNLLYPVGTNIGYT